tara:strand:- start:5068 stop:5286 length:219 start_codon:yes stop_codon:yes gene_type:complete
MDIMHGWFSNKQKKVLTSMYEEGKIGNSSMIYLNEKNEKVEVTEVTRKKEYSSKFDDAIYLGVLKSYVVQIK